MLRVRARLMSLGTLLEREELPRIRRIVRALPPGARAGVMGGIIKLAARAGVPAAGAALETLAKEARQLARTENEEDP